MAAKPLAFFTRIGPIEFAGQAPTGMYVAFDAEGQLLETCIQSPPNDGAGLSELTKKLPGHTARCAMELADVGAQLGIEPQDLPPRILLERAATAYVTRAMPYTNVVASAARELLAAGAEYLEREPWKRITSRKSFGLKAIVRSVAEGQTYTLLLCATLQRGDGADGPALLLEDGGDFSRHFVKGRQHIPLPMRARVVLASEPSWLADAVEEAHGVRFAPRISYLLGGKLTRPHPSHALLLAAVLRASIAHASGGAGKGRALEGGVEVDVEMYFDDPLPPMPPPTLETPLERRAYARLVAQNLAAVRPMARFDEHVCVVMEWDDPLGRGAYAKLQEVSPAPEDQDSVDAYLGIDEVLLARWVPAKSLVEWFGIDRQAEEGRLLLGALPHEALRVLLVARNFLEAFHVDFDPREAARLGDAQKEKEHDEMVAYQLDWGAHRKPLDGTWRDGMVYLPKPPPSGWSVGARFEDRGVPGIPVTVGSTTFRIGTTVREGRPWVTVLFPPEGEGREIPKDSAQALLRHLVGVGRFIEMKAYFDAEEASRQGSRIFHAVVAKPRPQSKVPGKRSRAENEALVERMKPLLVELLCRARDEKRPLADFCVLATPTPVDLGPGVPDSFVLSRDELEEVIDDERRDTFDIRGRFDQPRPVDECLVLLKHPDGVEEMHVSVGEFTQVPIAEA